MFGYFLVTLKISYIYVQVWRGEGAGAPPPPLRQQLEEHDAERDVDEQHQKYQLLPREPVLKPHICDVNVTNSYILLTTGNRESLDENDCMCLKG